MKNKFLVIEATKKDVRLLYGSLRQGEVEILFSDQSGPFSASDGLFPLEAATKALSSSLDRLLKAGLVDNLALTPTIAVLPSDGLAIKEGSARSYSTDTGGFLRRLDYRNCLYLIQRQGQEEGYVSLCCYPYLFACGDEECEQFPLQQKSDLLTVHADHYLLPDAVFERYRRLFLAVGIKPYLLYFENLAACHYLPVSQKRREFFLLNLTEEASVLSLVKDNRLLANRYLGRGLDVTYRAAAERFSLTLSEARDSVRLFGFDGPEEDIPYPVAKIPSTRDFRRTTQEEYDKVLTEIGREIDSLDEGHLNPVVVFGNALEVPGGEGLLSTRIPRLHSMIRTPIVGAHRQDFIPCLGALKMAYENFQAPFEEVRKSLENDLMRDSAFGRNERRNG